MMFRGSKHVLFAIAALTVLSVAAERSSALGVAIEPLTDERLVACSAVIVEGRVLRTQSSWNKEGTQIRTTVEIAVAETLKGVLPNAANALTITMLGGTVGDITMRVGDGISFAADEHVMLFLRPDYQQAPLPLVGHAQGKVLIQTDATTAKDRVPSTGETRDDFMRRIREIVKRQSPPSDTKKASDKEGN